MAGVQPWLLCTCCRAFFMWSHGVACMHSQIFRVSVILGLSAAAQRSGQRPATSATAGPCSMLLRPKRPEHAGHCAVLLLWAHHRLLPAGQSTL